MESKTAKARRIVRKRGLIRASEMARQGLPGVYLQRMVQRGEIERRGRGLYALPGAEVTEHHTLAEVARMVPSGVVCLLSALAFHQLGTQLPHQVWLAIDRKARHPRRSAVQLRIVRMSGQALVAGVEVHRIEGTAVRIFDAAKTVADCFKFRNKVGLDVAVEALRAYRRRRGDLDALWRYAKVCRVSRVIQPYLEALT